MKFHHSTDAKNFRRWMPTQFVSYFNKVAYVPLGKKTGDPASDRIVEGTSLEQSHGKHVKSLGSTIRFNSLWVGMADEELPHCF